MNEPPPKRSQPDPTRRRRVLEAWLETEHLDPSERLDRLAGDAELEALLREQGFEGDDWEVFVHILAEYGMGVFGGWIKAGVVVGRCAQKSVKVPTLPRSISDDPDARDDIAGETVAEAIYYFRENVLLKGIWDPNKGAALKSFFIGQCMFRYANVASNFLRHETQEEHTVELKTKLINATEAGRITGVEDDAIRMYTAELILRGATNERAARTLALDACGYTNAEIAGDLGIGLEAVKGILKRERQRIRQSHQAQGGLA